MAWGNGSYIWGAPPHPSPSAFSPVGTQGDHRGILHGHLYCKKTPHQVIGPKCKYSTSSGSTLPLSLDALWYASSPQGINGPTHNHHLTHTLLPLHSSMQLVSPTKCLHGQLLWKLNNPRATKAHLKGDHWQPNSRGTNASHSQLATPTLHRARCFNFCSRLNPVNWEAMLDRTSSVATNFFLTTTFSSSATC